MVVERVGRPGLGCSAVEGDKARGDGGAKGLLLRCMDPLVKGGEASCPESDGVHLLKIPSIVRVNLGPDG